MLDRPGTPDVKMRKNRAAGQGEIFGELRRLAAAVAGGELSARASLDGLDGEARQVAADMNRMLDVLSAPLNTATGALHSLAEGQIPDFVVDDYPGEFNRVKRDTNVCVAMLVGVLREIEELVECAKAGRLAARGNDWDFAGCWKDLLSRLNEMVDAFIAPFQVASRCLESISQGLIPDRIAERYPGELNRIRRNLNTLVETLNLLLGEVNQLCAAAIEGRLDERAQADRYGHEFRRIVSGINGTLDAMTGPLHASAEVLKRVSQGDLTVRVEGVYSGEFARLQGDINTMVERLRQSMAEIHDSAGGLAAASDGLAAVGAGLTKNADQTLARASAASESSLRMAEGVRALSDGAGQTRHSIEEIAENIGEVSRQTQSADADARRTLLTVSQLARASEDIGEVIKLIGGIAQRSTELASGARVQAETAEGASRGFRAVADEVKRLADQIANAAGQLGEKIGGAGRVQADAAAAPGADVERSRQDSARMSREIARGIQDISQIAWQTKILSINAVIEGARAGESGRQFSLVAEEIGNLAGQTSHAAGDIGSKLEAIGAASREGATAVEAIGRTVGSLRQVSEQIAGEVRQRAETTREMVSLASSAAGQADEIVENVTAVAKAATSTSAAVRQADQEARKVAETADRLRQLVNGFRV